MNDLNQALVDIGAIRRQMARSTEFRGYGPATLAATGVFALGAAGVQARLINDPAAHIGSYLNLWIATALLSAALTGAQMVTRTRRIRSSLSQEMLRMACEQFLPAAAAGILLTVILARCVPSALWMLPGLWQIVFSLGIFSSCRFLPRPMLTAGVWYLSTGLFCIALDGTLPYLPGRWAFPSALGNCWSPRCSSSPTTELREAESRETQSRKTRPPMKSKSSSTEGRFAYEGLDRVIHERARLSILTSLITNPKGVAFVDLKQLCALTDGNLSRHLSVLEEAKMVAIEKGHNSGQSSSQSNNRPQTVCRITASGRGRYLEYLSTLEQVVKDAAKGTTEEPSGDLLRVLTPSRV